MRWLWPLLLACASPQSLVRARAAKDFDCPKDVVSVETRERHYARNGGFDEHAYIARGCRNTVVYAVGGEWLMSWAAPCAQVTVRGNTLRADPFASIDQDLCLDTIADAGAVAPAPGTSWDGSAI